MWKAQPWWSKTLAVVVLFLVLAIVLPSDPVGRIMAPQSSWPNVLSEDIGVFILLAIGLNVVVGQAGMLDLGYVAFYAVGGYALALLATRHHWDFWVILPLGIAIAALSGLILGAPDPAAPRRLLSHRDAGVRADHLHFRQQLQL